MWFYDAHSSREGHLRKNGHDGQAAKAESNGAPAKMPSAENTGHLSADAENKQDDNHSSEPISSKMPSPGGISAIPDVAVEGDLATADVAERTCAHCGRHKFWDLGNGLECEMCGEPLVTRWVTASLRLCPTRPNEWCEPDPRDTALCGYCHQPMPKSA
jgi:hypothetical protein